MKELLSACTHLLWGLKSDLKNADLRGHWLLGKYRAKYVYCFQIFGYTFSSLYFMDNLQSTVIEPCVNLRCRSKCLGVQPWVKEMFSKKFYILTDIICMHAPLKILPWREIIWRETILHWHRNEKSDFTMPEMTVALPGELDGSEAGVWWFLLQCRSHRHAALLP